MCIKASAQTVVTSADVRRMVSVLVKKALASLDWQIGDELLTNCRMDYHGAVEKAYSLRLTLVQPVRPLPLP